LQKKLSWCKVIVKLLKWDVSLKNEGDEIMPIPDRPKIYHIVHIDRLRSIIKSKGLLCDAAIVKQQSVGTSYQLA